MQHDVRYEGSRVLWDILGSGWPNEDLAEFCWRLRLIWIYVRIHPGFDLDWCMPMGPRMRSMEFMLLRHIFGQVLASSTVEFLEENC